MKLLRYSATGLCVIVAAFGLCSCDDNPFEDMTPAQLQSVWEIKNGIEAADSLLQDLRLDVPHQMFYDWERVDSARLALRHTILIEFRSRIVKMDAVSPMLHNIATHISKLKLGDLDDKTYMDFRLEQVHKVRQIYTLTEEIDLHRKYFMEFDTIVSRVYADELDYWNWDFMETRINTMTEHRARVREAIANVQSVFADARSIFDAYPIPKPVAATGSSGEIRTGK